VKKKLVFAAIVMSLLVISGCGIEGKGDAAWKQAQKYGEGTSQRLMKQKEAYMAYKTAYDKASANLKVSAKLLNSYLTASIARIEFIFGETQSANDPAVRILRQDIEKTINSSENVTDEVKNRYARFLVSVANNYRENDDITRAMAELKAAKEFAVDKAIPSSVEMEAKMEYAAFQVSSAQGFMNVIEAAKKTKDGAEPLDYIRAEYYAKAALIYDPLNTEALKILATTRRELIPSLTAYEAGITQYSDTALFRQINSDGILMAVPTVRSAKGNTTLEISFYNNSFNAVKPMPRMFTLTTIDGKEIAASNVEFDKKALEQKHDVKGRLTFKGNFDRNNIKKLSFFYKRDEDTPAIAGDKFFQ
jgi:hypothetical protein